jgi:hypothetical protein
MPIPAGENCGNCKYMDFAGPFEFYGHEVTVGDVQIGYCRVGPALPAVRNPNPATSSPPARTSYVLGVEWPEVRADDWCGDWSASP